MCIILNDMQAASCCANISPPVKDAFCLQHNIRRRGLPLAEPLATVGCGVNAGPGARQCRGARSMPHGQIVIGPPGAGKTTYCAGLQQFFAATGR
jgi:Conserved hypothetical ATP binding protein